MVLPVERVVTLRLLLYLNPVNIDTTYVCAVFWGRRGRGGFARDDHVLVSMYQYLQYHCGVL